MVRALILSLSMMVFAGNTALLFAWPIPDTGQTKCYDEAGTEIDCDGTGQDGEYLINPPSYTKLDANGNDLPDTEAEWVMVRDNVTGLIWEVKTDDGSVHDKDNKYTWYCPDCPDNGGDYGVPGDGTDTEDFISTLNVHGFGGRSDWRLPTREELRSIMDYGIPHSWPTINTYYFPNAVSSYYWSSSTDTTNPGYAWHVYFAFGSTNRPRKSGAWHVRAVRGGQIGSIGHLVSNDDDTVTDVQTGLMWRKSTVGAMSWEEAQSHCMNMTMAGYDDWRLPTVKELGSIVALDRRDPSIQTSFFPETFASNYWSSSTDIMMSSNDFWANALYVNFSWGYDGDENKSNAHSFRAVRGGQNQISGNLLIQQPRQASFWNVNSTLPITWDTANIPGSVEISISYAGGRPGTYQTIATSTPNDGEHEWIVEANPSFNCMIKIEPISDRSKATEQGLFSIFNHIHASPSSLGLTEPASPNDTPESETFKILLSSDPGGDLEIELASSNPGECSVSPAAVTLNGGNWNTGVEVTVTPEYDGIRDGEQITSILASTLNGLGAFQARDLPLVQVIVQDAETDTVLHSAEPAYGEAGETLDVTLKGFGFTSFTRIYILPDGGAQTEITPVTFINDTTLSVTIPPQAAGNYNLKANSFEMKNAVSFASSAEVAAQRRKKAIVVAGGASGLANGFWLATDKCATHAYETLAFLGYDPTDIQFLSGAFGPFWRDVNGDGENDVDGGASPATLQAAIDSLTGADTDELLLYLVGPAASGQFQFGSDADPEYLTPFTLDSWLDALQDRISGRVVVVVDAPQSGGFLSALRPPSGKERVVITATNATEAAWFLDDGEISFSYRLFSHLFDNSELFSAFDKARDDISALQTPQIDATGDGVPDLRRLRNGTDLVIGRGRNVEISPPGISGFTANPSFLDDGSYSSSLSANGVEAPSGLSRIWCRLVPPIQILRNPARPVLTAPAVKLFDLDSDGYYEGEYGEFFHDGQYRALAYAVDRAGAKSFPKEATVTQTQGIPMEIDPGDVNTDGRVDLADAIRALQVAAGMNPHALRFADADGDERIGLEDALFILQTLGKMRP